MPSRLLREGILDSDRIEQLDWPAEVFYRRLMSKVDDYGLFDARLSTLRTSLYPLRVDRVREADIARWMAACQKAGVIALYEHGGKPYGQMLETRWAARSQPKHPVPPWGLEAHPSSGENSCTQMQTPVPVFGDEVGDVFEDGGGKKARKRAPKFDPASVELPQWLSAEAWGRWCRDRADRKKPVTELAAQGQIRKLEAYMADGFTPEEVIEHSIANGYQGLYAPARNRSQSRAAENAAVIAELTGGLMAPKPKEQSRATGEIIDV